MDEREQWITDEAGAARSEAGAGGGEQHGHDRRCPRHRHWPSPTVPDYKKDKIDGDDWNDFLKALRGKDRLGAARSGQQQFVYSEIFAAEGGVEADGTTVAGITAKTLHDLVRRGYAIPGVTQRTSPEDLSDAQRAAFYDAYFDDILRSVDRPTRGSKSLDEITDPESAAAFADVLLREGRDGPTTIQNAVNDVLTKLPPEERERLGLPDQIDVDRAIGPQSFGAYRTLANSGHGAALRNALADRRLDGDYGDETARIGHFRFNHAARSP